MKYDELIKHLRYCGTHDCVGEAEELIGCMAIRSDRDCKNCNSVLQLDAADAIEELQSQLPKWIPVTERLPELRMWESGSLASSNVLFVTEDKTIHIGYVMEDFHFNDNGCLKIDRWFMQGGYRIENVTHWMPLPEPPKEETDG